MTDPTQKNTKNSEVLVPESMVNRRYFMGMVALSATALAASLRGAAQDDAPPFRLGVVGSDNSHAEHFTALFNLEEGLKGLRIPGAQVTHICGDDPELTQQRAEKVRILNVVAGPQEMIGRVDGVLCVRRHGGRHLEDARPFLEAGIPVYVDKPLAVSVEDAARMLDLADMAKVGFTSFSTLRYARTTQAFYHDVRANAGRLRAGVLTGPCDLESQYSGVFFYGIHTVELMLDVFGYECQRVRAIRNGDNAAVVCTYPDGLLVTLNLLKDAKSDFHIAAFGDKARREHEIDPTTAYYDGMLVALNTLKTGEWPLSRDQLLAPIKVLAAIDRSLKEGGEVEVG